MEEKIELIKSFNGKDINVIEDEDKIIVFQIFNELIINISQAKQILKGMLQGNGLNEFKIEAEENEENGKITAFATFNKNKL